MRFAQPDWLWLLIAVPIFLGICWWEERRRARQLATFINQLLWSRIVPEANPAARVRKVFFWSLGAAFAVLALARPQWGMREETVKTTGLDLMVVLDVSNSMQVEDVPPTRLLKAKHLIETLTEKVDGDRVGIVAFAASAYVAVPLTTDLGYVREAVDVIDSGSIAQQGSDIGAGLLTARRSLERGAEDGTFQANKTAATHVLLLLTDGEDHEGQVQEEAKKLAQAGIRLYVIGIGTSKGGPVPVRDKSGRLVGFKKDSSGAPVVSAFNPETLMKVASAGNGKYWNATSDEREIDELISDLSGMTRADFAERKRMVWEERFQYPLAIAVLIFLIELCLPARRMVAAATLLLAPLSGWGAPLDVYMKNEKGIQALSDGEIEEARKNFGAAQARDPGEAALEYNQGLVQLRANDMEGAVARFDRAAEVAAQRGNFGLAARSRFNAGLAQSQKSDFKGAALSYLKALEGARQVGDADLEKDIRKNIELLNQQKQQQQQSQDGEQGEKKPEDKKEQGEGDKEKKKDSEGDKKGEEKKPEQRYGETKDKKFKSEKLSDEDAERVMAELGSKDKDLQGKIKKQNGPQGRNEKDW